MWGAEPLRSVPPVATTQEVDARMCGILGYVGPRQAAPLILDGLRRLEYRGYDSAGIATIDDTVDGRAIDVRKAQGKIDRLSGLLDGRPLQGTVGIGHTRWATHGEPSDANAHPHVDPSGRFVVVHNGIIENFHELKNDLVAQGHVFTSDTDTEVLAHLVANEYDGDLVEAVRRCRQPRRRGLRPGGDVRRRARADRGGAQGEPAGGRPR